MLTNDSADSAEQYFSGHPDEVCAQGEAHQGHVIRIEVPGYQVHVNIEGQAPRVILNVLEGVG